MTETEAIPNRTFNTALTIPQNCEPENNTDTTSVDEELGSEIKSTPQVPDKYAHIAYLDVDKLKPALTPIHVVDEYGLKEVARYLSTPREYAKDFETNVTDRFFPRRIRTIQIGDRDVQFVIDLLSLAGSTERLIRGQGQYRRAGVMPAEDIEIFAPLYEILRPSFESNLWLKVGHNLEFEYTTGKWCLGLRSWHYYCTLLGERHITNGRVAATSRDAFGLDDLVRKYLNRRIDKSSQTSFNLTDLLTPKQITYAALDIRLPLAMKAAQQRAITEGKLQWAVQIDMNAIPAFGDMHLNGMLADKEQWQEIIAENKRQKALRLTELDRYFIPVVGRKKMWDEANIERLKNLWESSRDTPSPAEVEISTQIKACRKDKELTESLKEKRAALQALRAEATARYKAEYLEERKSASAKAKSDYAKMEGEAAINYGASAQVLKALHEAGVGLNEKNCPNTDAKKTLIKHMDIPIVQALVAFKKVVKQLETYGERWITNRDEIDPTSGDYGFVDPDTGRIHARFRQFGADTGRPSCTNPNLLNLPRDDRYRAAFVSRPGYDLVCKDCAGQELCILCQYSKEPAWVEAFTKGQDVHSMSTEIINRDLWHKSANHTELVIIVAGKQKVIPPCAYFHNNKQKCQCPKHKEVRDIYKALTLGLIYDKSAFSFAVEMNKPKAVIEPMLFAWKSTFKATDLALQQLRNGGYEKGEARSLSGRRRYITPVSLDQAKKAAAEKFGDKNNGEKTMATYQSLIAGVKREAGNMPTQGTGADLMLQAMGCGFDPKGEPYMWHVLEPKYGALLQNYVYDEFVVESPEEHSQAVSDVIESAIIRAGAEFVTVVPMKSEGKISKRWQK